MNDQKLSATVYGPLIVWERAIQIIAADWLKPGDVVFDVGTNTGGLAIAFSRLVGPQGKVIGFECNPKMIEWATMDIAANHSENVEIVPKACFSSSEQEISFYCDDSFYSAASSAVRIVSENKISVQTIALDDFCLERNIGPNLIKIDVEGAESEVLTGASRILKEHRPVIVFEYSASENTPTNPIKIIQACDYLLYDVNSYELVNEAYLIQQFSTNVIAIPSEALDKGYEKYLIEQFVQTGNNNSIEISVPAGRVIFSCKLVINGDAMSTLGVYDCAQQPLIYYTASVVHLAHHCCSSLVINSDMPRTVVVRLSVPDGMEVSLLKGVDVYSVRLA